MTTGLNETENAWRSIVRIDRTVEMPEDPTLHKAAVWYEVFEKEPDSAESKLWATYVADVWEEAVDYLERLPRTVSWVARTASDLLDTARAVRATYDAAMPEWRMGSAPWAWLEAEQTRRLVRYVIASQQWGVRLLIEEGHATEATVRSRLGDPYVAGYLSGLETFVRESVAAESAPEHDVRLEIFRALFGDEQGEVMAMLFFERFVTESTWGDGIVDAIQDAASHGRAIMGLEVMPRKRLLAHLTS